MTIILNLDQQVTMLKTELEGKESDLKYLNERVNKLTEELEKVGCSIIHAMGIDFEIKNELADKLQNKLDRIAAQLRAHDIYDAFEEIFEE